jgi:hypothetical protein
VSDGGALPFRSQEVLKEWLAEFSTLGYPLGLVKVIAQDGTAGGNTGLIVLSLENAGTVVSIEPRALNDPEWIVTFEAREHTASLTAASVAKLSADLGIVSALCAYLQAKSHDAIQSQRA